MSLDGFIAGPRGEVGFLDPHDDAMADFGAFIKTLGAIVIGRSSFDFMAAHSASSPFGDLPIHVLTHRPLNSDAYRGPITPVSGDVTELAARLRAEHRGDIWLMGGGKVYRQFHERGLIDRWDISIVPVILGRGIPLLPDAAYAVSRLTLANCRTSPSGVVSVVYETHRAGTTAP
jgi:dihydrofolate reductase